MENQNLKMGSIENSGDKKIKTRQFGKGFIDYLNKLSTL